MRKINKDDYVEFIFKGRGYNLTANFDLVMNTYKDAPHGIVYGRKQDGTLSILDSK